ncbi:MAG TPA: 2-dehydropantoate 2-reductase [Ktedonobacterales bacterium]|nr:2-dehydropantoate 2-reductase [Ktedonobacterales bacterium]
MKIAVIGAGAVGSVIGGLLARAGEDVTLIGRKPQVDAINTHGLLIDGALGEMRVPVAARERLDFSPDLALLGVKIQDIEATIRDAQPHIASSLILTLQNGVRADDLLAGLADKANILSGVVVFGAIYLEPGKVTYSPAGRLVIGNPFGPITANVREVAETLNKGLPTHVSDDIRGAHWTKLIINENNALPAITGLSLQRVNTYPQLRRLSVLLMREAVNTMTASGISLGQFPGVSTNLIKILLRTPMPVASALPRLLSRAMGETPFLGSTLQSLKRAKSTEIDYLNGEIVALGKQIGRATLYNTTVVNLVHQVEATGEFLSVDEVAAAVAQASHAPAHSS